MRTVRSGRYRGWTVGDVLTSWLLDGLLFGAPLVVLAAWWYQGF